MPWQLALAQHPMYFLIKEDEHCAERTPPWGAPDVTAYTERLRRVFDRLRQHPQLKIGFEWSALELEHLARDARPVFDEMLALAAQGQIAFYNGTYAQPHLQTLSAESNYRQFEFGARVYRELCGQRVRVYAHQETSFNEQTPQLLKAFGLEFVVLPHFLTTLVLEDVELVYHPRAGATFVQGSEFVRWRGLDGTLINTYLRAPLPRARSLPDWLAGQQVQGPLSAPSILVDTPDLIEMDEAWLAAREEFEFVLLDEALPKRLLQAPARGQARLFSNWSYIEGIRAEELARANWLAEQAALRAEAMGALARVLAGRAPDSTAPVWETILTSQHHDVYCFCAPDLKRKSIGWLRAAEEQAQALTQAAAAAILPRLSAPQGDGEPIVVFNTTPHPVAAPVTIDTRVPNPAVRTADDRPLPCEVETTNDGASRVTFVAQAGGLGYSTVVITPQTAALAEAETEGPLVFENAFYQAVTGLDGTLASLRPAPGGPELLGSGQAGAGSLAGVESAETASPTAGTALAWQPLGPPRVRRSDLGARLSVAGRLGRAVEVRTTIQFYHQLPWIDFTWIFDFEQASLGDFFDDDSKLRVQFPLAFHGHIHHDIAFGVTTSLEDRPFFPASWVDVSDGAAGLAYFHQGTLKHWVTSDVLTNLLAWGEDTDAIGNRLGPGRWPKRFDQRLVGRHTIRAALYPHRGDWLAADVVGVARNFAVPLLAFFKPLAAGPLPPSLNVFELRSPHLAATAVMTEAEHVACRFYSYASQPQPVALHLEKMSLAGLTNLSGEALEQIGPFQIGQLRFEPHL